MPIKSLPSNPSLEHLKYQARDLLNALSQGNTETVARTREFHPKFSRMSNDEIRSSKLTLADAQLIIAREYGFESWPKLKHHVESLAQTASSTIAADFKTPSGPVELKWKWPAGARIVREMSLRQNMEIHTPGKPDPVKYVLSMTTQYVYTVVREHPTGGREVELRHLSFHLEFDKGSYIWRYDSAWKYAEGLAFAEPFKAIMAAKIRYYLNSNNQIERMEGLDELVNWLTFREGAKVKPGMTWDNQALDNIIHRFTSGARQPLVADDSLFRNIFTEEYFKRKLDPRFLPTKAVQPGDTWDISGESVIQRHSVPIGEVGITRNGTSTFQGWETHGARICARLEFRGTEKTRPQLQTETARIVIPTADGTFSGVAWFDPELGRAIETVSNRDFTVTSNKFVAAPYANPKYQAATDHHHQVITEKLISVNGPGEKE